MAWGRLIMEGLLGYPFPDRWDTGMVVMSAQIKHRQSLGLKGGDLVTRGSVWAQVYFVNE